MQRKSHSLYISQELDTPVPAANYTYQGQLAYEQRLSKSPLPVYEIFFHDYLHRYIFVLIIL